MSQLDPHHEPVEDTTKPDFAPFSVVSSHTIAHALAMPHARLEDQPQQSAIDEQHIQRIREIEKQITADDYQNRSCFECPNFPNPALVAFQRLQSALQQRSTASTENMIQRNATGESTGRLSPRSSADALRKESIPQQLHRETVMFDVVNSRSPHSVSQRDHPSARCSLVDHSHHSASILPDSVQPQDPPSNANEFLTSAPVSSKRRRIMSGRYTYSHHEMWQLRHYNKSLDGRKLGSRAFILLTDGPPAPTPIHVKPKISFAEMHLSPPILRALHSLDFHRPSPIQQAAIPRGRIGSDIIAHAKSGTGKTIAFIIIALESLLSLNTKKRGFTSVLILVPTRELADQVASVFCSLSKFMNPKPRALAVKGGTPEAIDEQQLSLSTPHVVIGTPGRVITLMQKGIFVIDHISLLVLDEADRLAESSFSHSVPEICELLPARRQTVAFSATFEPWLRDLLLHVMRKPAFFSFPSSTHANDDIDMLRRAILDKVRQYKIPVPGSLDAKLDRVTAFLSKTSFSLCIVFLNDKRFVAKILMRLKNAGFRAGIMNANLDQSQRDRTLLSAREGKLQIIVASDLLARGVDFEDCDLILQLDVPYNPATYLHRVGRAGRYGRCGSSFLFYNTKNEERNHVLMLETSLGSSIAVFDNPSAGNRSPLHHRNESRGSKPARYTSMSEYNPNPGPKSSYVFDIRDGGHRRASEDNPRSRRISGRNVDDSEVRRSSLTSKHSWQAPGRLGAANTSGDKISGSRIDDNVHVRGRNPHSIPEKNRDHLLATQVKQNKNSPSNMGEYMGRECETIDRDEDGGNKLSPEKSTQKSTFPLTAGFGSPKAPKFSQREQGRLKSSSGECPPAAKMLIGDEVLGPAVNHADDKGKIRPESYRASREVSIANTHGERGQYHDMRNGTNPGGKGASCSAADKPTDNTTAKGTERLREAMQGIKLNAKDRKAPDPSSESISDGREMSFQNEKMDVCAEREPYDMWDAYARDAYAAGFREAYEEAYRMGCELQDRLQDARI